MIYDEKIKIAERKKDWIFILKFLILFILISYLKFNDRFVRFIKFERHVPKFYAPFTLI